MTQFSKQASVAPSSDDLERTNYPGSPPDAFGKGMVRGKPYAIVRRIAGILLSIGFIDIALTIYCEANGVSYQLGPNLLAVIGGVSLLIGSAKVVSRVRWFAFCILGVFVTALAVFPFLWPPSLILTQVRLSPVESLMTATGATVSIVLLLWVCRELRHPEIEAALASAGIKRRDMRIPFAVGLAFVVLLGTFVSSLVRGATAEHAKAIAKEQVGQEYRLSVRSLSIEYNNGRKVVSGIVIAWNEKEIIEIPVQWVEE